eukprot:GFUD01000780.1.p1 GENE.GFUD01000780.1~~GFUD01000780.1.p1  ORF type:complete len:438 (+),score=126.29 GFUD01000780.1:338-1651(+)
MLVLASILFPLVLSQSDYCQVSPQHTLCQFKGPGPDCNGQPLSTGVNRQEAEQIVAVHNRYRSLVARGEEDRGSAGGQPGGANIRQMAWDEELSSIAQRHADQCKFEHDCTECRKTERFGVGQNLYIYKQSVAAPANDWEQAVTDWYEEVTDFNNKNIEPFQFSSATGHYTQVLWAESDKVGCGATSYKDGRWFTTLYVCNYGPNGNFIRGQMYQQGPACSACGEGFECSTEFTGLCVAGASPPTSPVQFPEPSESELSPQEQPTRRPTTVRPFLTTFSNFIDSTDAVTELFNCNFDDKENDCKMKNKGKPWSRKDLFGNEYQEISLENQEKTEFYFEKQLPVPSGNIACIDFRFKKFSEGVDQPTLSVLAQPTVGKPGVVSIVQNSPDQFTWIRALVTLRNINTDFALIFRAEGPQSGNLLVGVDDVKVTEGKCSR